MFNRKALAGGGPDIHYSQSIYLVINILVMLIFVMLGVH
jgi:hypothetical protein